MGWGESRRVAAAVALAEGGSRTDYPVDWASLDPTIASVRDGVLYANGVGTAQVVASVQGWIADTLRVRVTGASLAQEALLADLFQGFDTTVWAVYPPGGRDHCRRPRSGSPRGRRGLRRHRQRPDLRPLQARHSRSLLPPPPHPHGSAVRADLPGVGPSAFGPWCASGLVGTRTGVLPYRCRGVHPVRLGVVRVSCCWRDTATSQKPPPPG